MTLRALVIVADDAGFHADTDAAILDCVGAKSVTAAAVAVTGETWREATHALLDADVDVGLHFNLTEGCAVGGPYDTLTDENNCFHAPKLRFHELVSAQRIDVDEIEAEFRAQWGALCAIAAPVFLNGHNHVHLCPDVCSALYVSWPESSPWIRVPVARGGMPAMFDGVCLPENLDCVRALGRSCEDFVGWSFSGDATFAAVRRELDEVTAPTCEWMTHPGAREGSDFSSSPMRNAERDVLCHATFHEDLAAMGFRAIRYRDLA